METLSVFIRFTEKELEDVLKAFGECSCDQYIKTGDPAYTAFKKLQTAYENFHANEGEG